ncbi:MAG: PEP-CTERM sorting domain-containing protein [Pirellulaceae bacterium]|nr:PEP-CTERM sorting domain-containing protein [Planctomycetales bacterium]
MSICSLIGSRHLPILCLILAACSTVQAQDRLRLHVDRDSGIISIENLSSVALDFDGYSIGSIVGSLGPSPAWSSLQSQSIGNWFETNNSKTRLGELEPLGVATLGPGESLSLGAAFVPSVTAAFGTNVEDLTFDYASPLFPTGVSANVVYEGDKYQNNFVLAIDPTTGMGELRNESAIVLDFDGYLVQSASGSLSPSAWFSLADQSVNGWTEAVTSNHIVSELEPFGSLQLQPGDALPLGKLFVVGGAQDLSFEYAPVGQASGAIGVVEYVALSVSLAGDYNNNGVVDAADYTVWKDTFGINVDPNSGADGNGNGLIDAADYTVWKDNFGNAGQVASTQSVPEPSTWILFALGMLLAPRVSRVASGRRL